MDQNHQTLKLASLLMNYNSICYYGISIIPYKITIDLCFVY